MIYFIYKEEVVDQIKNVTCLATDLTNNKFSKTKIISEQFQLNDSYDKKWPWSDLSKHNHYVIDSINSANIPENLFFLAKEALLDSEKIEKDFLKISTNDLIIKYSHLDKKESSIKIEIDKNIIMFKAFLLFTNNPELVTEFQLFLELKEYSKNETYSIEDWICDMEESFQGFSND